MTLYVWFTVTIYVFDPAWLCSLLSSLCYIWPLDVVWFMVFFTYSIYTLDIRLMVTLGLIHESQTIISIQEVHLEWGRSLEVRWESLAEDFGKHGYSFLSLHLLFSDNPWKELSLDICFIRVILSKLSSLLLRIYLFESKSHFTHHLKRRGW